MTINDSNIRQLLFFIGVLAVSAPVCASDIAREVRGDSNVNFFEISTGVGCGQSHRVSADEDDEDSGCGMTIGLSGAYHWRGFFIEAIEDSYSGLNLGYNLWQNEQWQVDLIALNLSGTISIKDGLQPNMTEEERNRHLLYRDTVTVDAEVRATYYWQEYIVQMKLGADYSQNDGGAQAAFLVGKAWQARNWNFHGLTGVHWYSRQRNEYLWAVSDQEATERFPAYKARSAINYSIEVGATYPLSEHWVTRARAVAFMWDKSIADSPLAASDWAGGVETSISYVF